MSDDSEPRHERPTSPFSVAPPEADTWPPPHDVASVVLSEVKPILEKLFNLVAPLAELPKLVTQLGVKADGLDKAVGDLGVWRDYAHGQFDGLNNGMKAVIAGQVDLGEKVEKLTGTCERIADGLFAVSKDLQDLRTATTNQLSHEAEKRKELRQSVTDLEEAAEQRVANGE